MNRLVLIGNGFDIAHGLETRYSDFIKWFWEKQINEFIDAFNDNSDLWENDFIRVTKSSILYIKNKDSVLKNIKNYNEFITFLNQKNIKLLLLNRFLHKINSEYINKEWVDIEIEYYKEIKRVFNQNPIGIPYKIENLNRDFEFIKKELSIYLNDVENKFDINKKLELKEKIHSKMYAPIFLRDLRSKVKNEIINIEYEKYIDYLKRIKNNDTNKLIMPDYFLDRINLSLRGDDSKIKFSKLLLPNDNDFINNEYNLIDLTPDNTMLLNFNYTSLDNNYLFSDNDYSDNPKKNKS